MSNIIPFEPPLLLTASLAGAGDQNSCHIINSNVTTQRESSGRGRDNANNFGSSFSAEATPTSPLERHETTSGKIIEIFTPCDDTTPVAAFWLQRKLGHQSSSHNLMIRLAYKLRTSRKKEKDEDEVGSWNSRWELDTNELGIGRKVRIHMLPRSVLQKDKKRKSIDNSSNDSMNLNELSALQLIAKDTTKKIGRAHV